MFKAGIQSLKEMQTAKCKNYPQMDADKRRCKGMQNEKGELQNALIFLSIRTLHFFDLSVFICGFKMI